MCTTHGGADEIREQEESTEDRAPTEVSVNIIHSPVGKRAVSNHSVTAQGLDEAVRPFPLPGMALGIITMPLPRLLLSSSPRQGSSHLSSLGFGSLCLPEQPSPGVAKVQDEGGGWGSVASVCAAQ